jgi:hypothetical protein
VTAPAAGARDLRPDGTLALTADDIDRRAQSVVEGRFVPRERHERTSFTSHAKTGDDGAFQRSASENDPVSRASGGAGAAAPFGSPRPREANMAQGGGAGFRTSPTPSDDWPELPACLDRRVKAGP